MSGDIWTWVDGDWREGNVPIVGAADHGAWLGSLVFDGARSFSGRAPELEAHCARVNASARTMGFEPTVTDEEIVGLVREGLKKFGPNAETYIRPMIWPTRGSALESVPPACSSPRGPPPVARSRRSCGGRPAARPSLRPAASTMSCPARSTLLRWRGWTRRASRPVWPPAASPRTGPSLAPSW